MAQMAPLKTSYVSEQLLCLLQHGGQLSHTLFVPLCLTHSCCSGTYSPQVLASKLLTLFQEIQTKTKLILHTLFYQNCPVASVLLNTQSFSTSFCFWAPGETLRCSGEHSGPYLQSLRGGGGTKGGQISHYIESRKGKF